MLPGGSRSSGARIAVIRMQMGVKRAATMPPAPNRLHKKGSFDLAIKHLSGLHSRVRCLQDREQDQQRYHRPQEVKGTGDDSGTDALFTAKEHDDLRH